MRKHTISKTLAVTLATSLVTYSLPVNSQASMFPVTDNILNIQSDNLSAASNISYNVNGSTVTITGTGTIEDNLLYNKIYSIAPVTTITKVIVSDGITSIPSGFFVNMDNVTDIEIADSVTSIGRNAFSCLSKLKNIKLPKGLTIIDTGVFWKCASLEHIEIPEGVTDINSQSFTGCDSLKSAYVPDSVTYIDSNADFFRSGLVITTPSLKIKDKYGNIDGITINYTGKSNITGEISGIPYVLNAETNTLTLTATSTNQTVPGSLAKNLDASATITKVILSGNFTSIYSKAFEGFSSLSELELPDSIQEISPHAFSGTALETLRLPSSLKEIDGYGLEGMSKLKNIQIPASVITIGYSAFSGCSSLESIEIPSTVTKLCEDSSDNDKGLFESCSNLKSVTINAKTTNIGPKAFLYCRSLETVSLPNSITSLGAQCFKDCDNLTNIDIPNSVTSLGAQCFYDCDNLTDIDIPNSITSLGAQCFYHCDSLTDIDIPNSVMSLGKECFSGCAKLSSAKLPSILKKIPERAFAGCKSLKTINIPDTVTTIESYAFYNAALTSIKLPAGIQTILEYAFSGTQIQELYLPSSITYLGDRIITTNLYDITIKTPSEYVKNYCDENGLTCIYEEPTEPSTDETTSTEKPTQPSTDETTSTEKPTQPSTDETTSTEKPTQPSTDETTSTEKPTQPSTDETTSTEKPTQPSTDETTSTEKPTEPSTDETTSTEKPTEPSTDETTSTEKPTQPSTDETTSTEEPTQPSTDETTSTDKPTQPSTDETTGTEEPTEKPTEKLTYKFAKKITNLKVGTSKNLELVANDGSYADSRFVTWTSSNTKVIKVEAGSITAVSNGKATISAKYNNQILKMTITAKTPATGITLKKKSVTMVQGKKVQLQAKLKPITSTDSIKWSSSDKKIATVNSKGVVKALKAGYVSITAKTSSGKIVSCKITVKGLPNKISLNKKKVSLKIGKTYRLRYALPRDTVAKVTFSSVDKRIATVNSKGVIKAKAKGSTTIVAITSNGKIARCKVVVTRI